jgi:DNA modification methylase
MQKLATVSLSELQIHPMVSGIINNTSYPSIQFQFSLKHDGQKTPIVVVKRENIYLVIDGVHRYNAAVELGNIKTLECEVLDIQDDQILDNRIVCNQKTKIHTIEVCRNIEHILGLIGSEQGKRNDLLGNKNLENENEFGTAGQDRFEKACSYSGLPFSARTLRKLMAVYDYEKVDNSLKLIDGIDTGKYKIDGAHKLMKSMIDKQSKKARRKQIEIERVTTNVWFELFEQSATDLSNLKHLKPKFAMFSPPYWKMRHYRNQGEIMFGQEPSLQQYLDNSKKTIDELVNIMDENAVVVIVIGEAYKGGYKSITSRYELMLLDCGLDILGVCEWVKLNPTPAVPKYFFRPANEKIFVCKKKGAEISFSPKMRPTKDGKSSVKKCHSANNGTERYFVEDDSTIISNVITTAAFNHNEYKKYDPYFKHDAPCPMEIYDIMVSSYTMPGDTCIDIHCGSGQGLEVFARNGCNAIGVDIDPESIEFCEKRMRMVLGQECELELQMAA